MLPKTEKRYLISRVPPEFAQQITENQQRLYGYIRSLVGNSASSWDILQETNIVLWKKQADFQPGTNFDAWSFTIARFQVLAFLRDRKRDPLQLLTPDLLEVLGPDAEIEAGQLTDRLAALRKCLSHLTEKSRTLIDLHYSKGLKMKEIASSFGQSSAAVKQAIFRIRQSLFECIEKSTTSSSTR